MIVRFDQKRMIREYIHQQISGCIYHNVQFFILKMLHNIHIHGFRHCIRDASGKYQCIAILQCIQFSVKFPNIFRCNLWSLSVDFRLGLCPEFYVDTGQSLGNVNKICGNTFLLQETGNGISGKSCHKTKCGAFFPEIFQYH